MSIKVKDGVTPRILIIAAAAANVASTMEVTIVITSGTDGKHMVGSKHYTEEALDFRTSNLTKSQISTFKQRIKARLGPDYDVVLEKDHIHVEYDPD